MLHMFTHQAISQGVNLYVNSAAEFRRLFPQGVTSSLLESWRQKLVDNQVEIRLGHTLLKPETVEGLVTISLADETADEQVLGGNMGDGDVGCFVTQVVEVRVLAKEEFVVTALHQIIKATMHRAQLSFIREADVLQMDYDGASGLALEGEQRAEELGLYARFIYFKFMLADKFPLARIGTEDGEIDEIVVRLVEDGGDIGTY